MFWWYRGYEQVNNNTIKKMFTKNVHCVLSESSMFCAVVHCPLSVEWIMFLILSALCILLILLYLRRKYGTLEKMGIPVIKPGFCWGSEPLMIHKTNYLEWDLENTRKYGKVWGSYAISEPWITVGDPNLIRAILVKDHQNHFPGHSIEIGQKRNVSVLSV